MKIAVFGLGYVGCVTAACLAKDGNRVIGVDIDERKVELTGRGRACFYEPGLEELLSESVAAARLSTRSDVEGVVRDSEMAIVCVGTPSDFRGAVSLTHVRSVLTTIARSLKARSDYFVIVLRSTVLPNIVEEVLLPLIERESGKSVGRDIGFCYNPEFLREGSAIPDFYDPPFVIVGANDVRSAEILSTLYHSIRAPIIRTDLRTAAMVKYTCNMFHALKVTFANEIGHIAETMEVDAHALMEIVCHDTKLNIAPTYLKPGLAFGGSCLPKDLRAVLLQSRRCGLCLPLMDAILASNEAHLRSCIDAVLRTNYRNVGLVGLTFKEGTDDLRESPAVAIAETLIGKGCNLSIYEPAIAPGSIYGRNLAFVEHSIPHIWKLLSNDLASVLGRSEVIVILKKLSDAERACFSGLRETQTCIDFVSTFRNAPLQCGRVIQFGVHTSESDLAIAA
jgi:GDP-mannose 6-dehydrogenase